MILLLLPVTTVVIGKIDLRYDSILYVTGYVNEQRMERVAWEQDSFTGDTHSSISFPTLPQVSSQLKLIKSLRIITTLKYDW